MWPLYTGRGRNTARRPAPFATNGKETGINCFKGERYFPVGTSAGVRGTAGKSKAAMHAVGASQPVPQRADYQCPGRNRFAKKLFQASLHSLRCVVPCTGFYEWNKQKDGYRFSLGHSGLLYMAGIYAHWDDGARFVILTVPANPSVARVHDRMPLILPRQSVRTWLNDPERALHLLKSRGPALCRWALPRQPEQKSLFD